MTDLAQTKALRKLYELSESNEDTAIKIIDQSIEMGWAGLFELKNYGKHKTNDRADESKFEPVIYEDPAEFIRQNDIERRKRSASNG